MPRWGLSAVFCLLLVVVASAPAASRASRPRDPAESGPGLVIAADRVSGFVPFTVTVYGRVRGVEPDSIELCRLQLTSLSEATSDRSPSRAGPEGDERTEPAKPAACVSGRAVASDGWLSYEHDLRFDEAGQYHVRLTMVDTTGRRLTSNTVRVSAF